jgi:hypothetical protein
MSFELLVHFDSKLKTQHSKLLFRCHGDRFVPARFGPVGGLSRPRRDTANPKRFTIYDYRITISIVNHNSKIENHKATPCDRAIFSIVEIYSIYKAKSILFTKKLYTAPKIHYKNIKNEKNTAFST